MPQQPMHSPVLGEATLAEFQSSMRGPVLRPHDREYDGARRVWNGAIDRRPALIARCTGPADVIKAVQFARSHELRVAVRGGGHNVAGHAMCDGGMTIDLSPMKGIRVDSATRTVRAEAGLTWGEFDRETGSFGLATTGGLVSTTGIAGLTLGGGIGWLMRSFGLTCDNLLSADVVTADGRVLTASACETVDLFWGIRGGGGNFGIVTSFEYRLYPVSTVLGGMMLFPAARGREMLRSFREIAENAPDELTMLAVFMTAPPLPFISVELHGTRMIAIALCYAGAIDDGEEAVRPIRSMQPAVDLTGPMPYAALQSMFDPSAPPGMQNYWKSQYLATLDDETIDAIVDGAARITSPFSAVHIHQLGGAVRRVADDNTGVSYRTMPFVLNVIAAWHDRSETDQHVAWVRDLWSSTPAKTAGVYVSFLGEEGEDRVRAAYGAEKYEQLVTLKKRYDPTNFFSMNQNINPAD